MRLKIEDLALRAGERILHFYHGDPQALGVNEKDDGTPVTDADMAAHKILKVGLEEISGLPVVSEEDFDPRQNRWDLGHYWLVDPLDGTKDFLRRTDMFTVNIALIHRDDVLGGVVYAPALDQLYSAWDQTAFKNRQPLTPQPRASDSPLRAVVSVFHDSPEVGEFLAENQITATQKVGSSLKFCQVAAGEADLYPRLGPTSEWDTAAGQAVAEGAGCRVVTFEEGKRLRYSKPDIRNPYFLVDRPGAHEPLSWRGKLLS
jgi:3'(2'), 5'-bisphosphate nucleotidase